MPRKSRIDVPGGLHHIIIRGIEGKRIFRDDADRNNFLDRFGAILTESNTICYAWALIPNHIHLFLRSDTVPMATVMRRLLTGYAVTFNRRHKRHGHLFQNRYKSILCQEDSYFLELVRYIHLNPLRSSLVEDLECLDIYPYAGHSVVMGKRKNDWQEVDYVLAYFGKGLSISRKNYRSYVQEGIVQGKRKDLTGGGVVRSMGGWKEVKTSLTRGDRVKGDERILGDSDFVLGALKASEEKFERTFQIKKRGIDLEKLSKRVGMIFKVEPEKILSPGKYKNVVDARSVLCYWAVREIEISATDLAKRLKLSQPAVSIAVKRGNKIVREKGLILPID